MIKEEVAERLRKALGGLTCYVLVNGDGERLEKAVGLIAIDTPSMAERTKLVEVTEDGYLSEIARRCTIQNSQNYLGLKRFMASRKYAGNGFDRIYDALDARNMSTDKDSGLVHFYVMRFNSDDLAKILCLLGRDS